MTIRREITKQEARRRAVKVGIDFNADYNALRSSKVDTLLELRRLVGYKKSKSASGSTGRCFFYYLKRA